VSKRIDKAAGAERAVVGVAADFARDGRRRATNGTHELPGYKDGLGDRWAAQVTAPATDEAARWEDWSTTLKPAHEPIIVARKPLRAKSVGANLLAWQAGALNIGACRIPCDDKAKFPAGIVSETETVFGSGEGLYGDRPRLADRAPNSLVLAILKTPYKEYLEAEYIDSKDRLQDLLQLAEFAKRFSSIEEFLATATLQESFREVEDENLKDKKEPEGKIVLSTVHQAKGLEWEVVFVINLSAGAFPNERASRDTAGLEEERRLFYVAVTRAKKQLFLTYPMADGSFGDFLSGPSTFINEIAPGLLDDRSLLLNNNSVFDNEPRYVSEDEESNNSKPLNIKPGSFLRDIDDL
jgi:hypothetical protein